MAETQAPSLTDFELVCSRLRDFFGGRPVEWWALGLSLGVSCRV